jgi:predicted nucleotidyltransferase
MDWTDPTRAVMPTLDGAVLTVLAGVTEPLTGREVHRRARRGSAMGVYRALGRLEEQGLVVGSDAAPARLYRLNRDHVAADVAVLLRDLRTRLFDRIREELSSWPVAPVSTALFGSVARGDGNADSDVDVLLVRPDGVADDSEPWATAVFELCQQIRRWTGNDASALQADTSELIGMVARGAPIVESLTEDAIDLAGVPIRDLLSTWGAA